ncbi:MAG: ABC transporter permease subunit [Bacteroidota bacterium]|jgi:ABC-type dipeptide/oligopeptide/nickel transport system permease component
MRIISKIVLVVTSLIVVIAFSFSLIRFQSDRPLQAVTANNNFSQHAISVYDPSYLKLYHQYGLDLPSFYFSISNLALPYSYKYLPACDEKDFLIYWSCKTGSPETIYKVYQSLIQFHNEEWRIPPSQVLNLQRLSNGLISTNNIDSLNNYYRQYAENLPRESLTFKAIASVNTITSIGVWKQWVPVFHVHTTNQFGLWFSDWWNGGNGIYNRSWISKNKVGSVIEKPLIITLFITMITIVVIIFYSIFISAELFLNKENRSVNFILNAFHFFYSLPSFFIGALLIFIFSNPYQLQLFPSNFSFAPIAEENSITILALLKSWKYFMLPVVTLSFGAIVFFTLMLYRSFEEEYAKNYVLSAKMMGVNNRTIVYKYVLKNALYSSSTFLFLLFPALLSGSIIVEQLFSIAGIGNLLITAARSQDVPVLLHLFGLIGLVTALCFVALDYFQQKINGKLLSNKEDKE